MMAKQKARWIAVVVTVILPVMGPKPVRAADGPETEVLKTHGLKVAGALVVLEAELDVKNKVADARRLSRQLNHSLARQQGTMTAKEYQQTVKNLTQSVNQIRSQIGATSNQMNRLPRFRGMLATTMAQERYAELFEYRNQLQMELSEETAWLNQLKSQPFDDKSKDKVDAEVRDGRDAYHQAIVDLRTLVDSAHEKYAELAKNDDVKKALVALGKGKREKPKLSPSHEFLNNVKLLEKLERAEGGDGFDESKSKTGRKSKPGTRTKRSLKDAPADTGSGNG